MPRAFRSRISEIAALLVLESSLSAPVVKGRRAPGALTLSHAAAVHSVDGQQLAQTEAIMDEKLQPMTKGARRVARTGVQTIIHNEAVLLCYHPRQKIVHHEFHRFVHGAQFREVLEKGLDVFRTRGACKWLSDDRGNGPIKPADGEWALNDWSPRVVAAGWKYWAVILPEKVLGQMNMRRWIETYAKLGVTARVFADADEAMRWLENQ